MSELSSSFRDNIQVVERHNVVYVVSLTAKEELWLVSLIGQSSTYEAKLSKLDRQSMVGKSLPNTARLQVLCCLFLLLKNAPSSQVRVLLVSLRWLG